MGVIHTQICLMQTHTQTLSMQNTKQNQNHTVAFCTVPLQCNRSHQHSKGMRHQALHGYPAELLELEVF
jgi:hypothetical protein